MGTLSVPTIGKKGNTEHPKVNAAIEALNAILGEENKVKGSGVEEGTLEGKSLKKETIKREQLASESKPFTWYKPLVIATEESRTNVAFGTLTTADEIKEVVLPENGLILIGYTAIWKSSTSAAGGAAIFLGANQLKVRGATIPVVQEASTAGTGFLTMVSSFAGLSGGSEGSAGTSFVTTGQALVNESSGQGQGGLCAVFAAAGTYNISVRFKAATGSVTAKERRLWVATLG